MREKILFPISATFIGCLLAMVVCEGTLRVFAPQWLKYRMQEVGVENVTGVKGEVFGSDRNWPVEKEDGRPVKFTPFSKFRVQHYEYDIEVHIDQWGGRQTTNANQAGRNEVVPFLGDSFVFGVGVKDTETYVSLLGEKLPYTLINLGMPGSCLANQLDIIEHRHAEINSPKLYIFNVFIGNDLTNLLLYPPGEEIEGKSTKLMPLGDKLSTRVLQSINDFVRNNSFLRKIYFIQFIKSKFLILYNNYLVSRGIIQRMDDEIFHVIRDGQHFQDMLGLFDEQLKRLETLSTSLHSKPIFILVPDRHQVDDQLRRAKYEYYGIKEDEVDIDLANKSLKAKLDDYQMPYIDVLDCLRKNFDGSGHKKLYYTLDNHLTPAGHRAVYSCAAHELNGMIAPFFRVNSQ